ncbi:ABC transporter ATP-binding protein [Viridibacillus sp. NPDC093762]|uniref:ABC transporter ATP-binding protein n=1 Tax=Viridibacillus sp. NPDC093762 TaxID=3390720 RepID=UPI003D05CF8D
MNVKLNQVHKRLKKRTILDGIDLEVHENEIVGIVGPNGSGKTTILRLIAGLMYADQGEVYVNEQKIRIGDFPKNIGILIETPSFIDSLSGLGNLILLARIQQRISENEIRQLMEQFKLNPDLKDPVKVYSLGMNQRLGLVQAFMERPDLLLLDEPTNALDEESKQIFYQLLKERCTNGSSAIVISHDREEVQLLCDRVYALEEGKLKEVVPV